MINRKDLLAISFYEKSPFTGSDDGMRYRIEKITDEDGSKLLQATAWPEPFAFAHTPDEKKTTHTEAFSEEGLEAVAKWLNGHPGTAQ